MKIRVQTIFLFFASSILSSMAITHADAKIDYKKKVAEAYTAASDKLKETNELAAGIIYLRDALKKRPNDATIMFDLANKYNTANYNDEALKLYYTLLAHYPNNKTILYNTAYTLKKINKIQDAMFFYDACLKQDPNYPEARFSRSLAYLITGDFEKGWPEYEWRWNRPGYPTERTFDAPVWDGKADLKNKTVYLHAEQGFGDTFQFIRYAREIKKRGARVVVSVQKALVDVLSLCPYIDKVINLQERPMHFDYHAALMSLPYLLGTRVDTVPTSFPYLHAREDLVKKWRDELSTDTNFKVGICWQGNPNYRTPNLRAVVASKSFSAKLFKAVADVPGVTLYCLQRATGTDQITDLDFRIHVFDEDFDSKNGRFMDTAAVMKNLDLMITVDTSTAHFSAALGLDTWVFIPNPPDWRWMLDREDTPWYPNMRLFRQDRPGDWESVMKRVAEELSSLVAQRKKPKHPSRSVTTEESSEELRNKFRTLTHENAAIASHIVIKG